MNPVTRQQEDFIRAFEAIGDPLLQYDMLIDLYTSLPPLAPEEKTPENLVPGCVTPLWLVCGFENGRVRLRLESDALIVGGIAGMIVRLLDGKTPEDILSSDIFFIRRTRLARELSTDRQRGMEQLICRIRNYARAHASRAQMALVSCPNR